MNTNVNILFVVFMQCLYCLATAVLSVMHSYIAVFNVTTWEYVSRSRIRLEV